MSLDKIKENHKDFNNSKEVFEKLAIASKNATIQLKLAIKAMYEIKHIADTLGFKIDKDSGELIEIETSC